jgi:tRNA (guanine-N7-)-methyltransferase
MHSNDDQTEIPAGGAFFGRRKGKKLRAGQTLLTETLLPRLALDLAQPAPHDLGHLFPAKPARLRLEIGFGGGEHLIAQAENYPDWGHIGVEPFINGMAKALREIDTRGLSNMRLHQADAADLLPWLPEASLDRVDLLYPDPWPKRRHWKRRFVQDRTVEAIARVLKNGGEFRFATDIPDYACWTLVRLLRSSDFAWTAECADDWRLPWPDFIRTRYEAKAIREARVPCYLTFRRTARGPVA